MRSQVRFLHHPVEVPFDALPLSYTLNNGIRYAICVTDPQRWLMLGALVVLGSLTAIGALLLWPVGEPPSAQLAAYEHLWTAIERGEEGITVLDTLLTGDDGVAWHAAMAAGKAYTELNEPEEAADRFRRALELWPTAEARRRLARALEEAGQREEALDQWKLLLPSAEAAEGVFRLEGDPLRAAQLLNRGSAHQLALQALSELDTNQATLERARALSGLGELSPAAEAYQAYIAAMPGEPQARLEYGRLLQRQGHTEQALAAYQAAGPAGGLLAGRLLEEEGRLDEAVRAYGNSNDPEAPWRKAVLLEDMGKPSEALPLYRTLAESGHRVWDDAALRAHVLLGRQGAHREAETMLEGLPPAGQWLLGSFHGSPVAGLKADPPRVTSPATQRADALLSHLPEGEAWGWARAELEIALRRAPLAQRLTIGEWYLSQGDYAAACRVGTAVLAAHPCPRAYRLAYPLAHGEPVHQWARQYEVDQLLVLAVMREESHFRLRAVSPSDARGLMQLLPSTARWIAEERLGMPYQVDELFEPDTNIRLGTWYLGYLLEQFPGGIPWAVAAYNGGQGNIRRWTGEDVPLEDLPAALRSVETREYLSKVLHSWLIYRWLYEG
ncbi:MAG: transglycosylase SLT domain-containing protein [Candidatus Bipolaricaulota bacterium]